MKPVRSYANKFWRYYVDKNTVPCFIEWLDKIWQFQWCYWHFCKNSWCRKTVRQWWATATLKRCSTRSPDAEQDGKTRDHLINKPRSWLYFQQKDERNPLLLKCDIYLSHQRVGSLPLFKLLVERYWYQTYLSWG